MSTIYGILAVKRVVLKGHCFLTLFLLLLVLSEHWSCPPSPYMHITVFHVWLILQPWRWRLCIEMLVMMYQATWHHITVFSIFILFLQLVSAVCLLKLLWFLWHHDFDVVGYPEQCKVLQSIFTECLKQSWSQSLPLFWDVGYQQIMDTLHAVHFSAASTDWPERWFIYCGLLLKKCTK
jgi:hypothetical protein